MAAHPLKFWLGAGSSHYNLVQLPVRALVVYLGSLLLVRMGSNRYLGRMTVFDVVLGFVLGSMLSRAINGTAPIGPTLLAGLAIFMAHWVVSELASRNRLVARIFNGAPQTLIEDGELCQEGMRAAQLSESELASALRHYGVCEVSQVRLASLEQNGTVSVVKKAAQVIEVEVQEGVQRVRIEIS